MEVPHQFGPFSKVQVEEAFHSFDLDGNHFIGAAELRQVYISIGENVTDEEIDEMISMVDTDGDGQVSLPEFMKMVFKYAPRVYGEDEEPDEVDDVGRDGAHDSLDLIEPVGPDVRRVPVSVNNQERRWDLKEAMDELSLTAVDLTTIQQKFNEIGQDELDYEQFCNLLEMQPGPLVDRLFALFDVDESGTVNSKEAIMGMANFMDASRDDRIRFAFELFDVDHSGAISKAELLKILKANYMASSEKQVVKKAETIMRRADQDGDNQINYEEFVSVCKRFPNLIFPVLQG